MSRTKRKKLKKARTKKPVEPSREAQFEVDPDLDLPEEEEDPGFEPVSRRFGKRSRPDARSAVLTVAFLRATDVSKRRTLTDAKTLAVILTVPAADWVEPMHRWFASRFGNSWIVSAAGSAVTARDRLEVVEHVATGLGSGRPVAVVTDDRSLLPPAIEVAADLELRIAAPDAVDISRAIRLFTGFRPSPLDGRAVGSTGLEMLLMAFRRGSTAADIAARIGRTDRIGKPAASSRRLPDLSSAVEYGAAREWGLTLARDIEDFRAGLIQWNDVDRGAVLHSEPGLGKSTYARVLSEACNAPLVAFSIADLFAGSPGYLDSVIKASRAMFEKAKTAAVNSPGRCSILFLDEIDALPSRNMMTPHAASFWTSVLTDFMLSLDRAVAGTGSDGDGANILVLAATNKIDAVDPALMRPGRLERAIEVKRPSHEGIVNVLEFHLERALAPPDLDEVARLLAGSTPAEIMMSVRGARRLARQAKRDLTRQDLIEAIAPIDDGIAPAALLRLSIHEAAHAVASIAVPFGRVDGCVIGLSGNSAGRTHVKPDADDLATRDWVERRAVMILSGRAAEERLLGCIALGGGGTDDSDLADTTRSIASLYTSTGLGGSLVYRASHDDALRALRSDHELRTRVEQHMQALQRRAEQTVEAHSAAIVAVAERLRERRRLTGDDIRRIVAEVEADARLARNIRMEA